MAAPTQKPSAKHSKNQAAVRQEVECGFDSVLDMTCTQEDMWNNVRPRVEKVLDGRNSIIFTYGMTSSGKTHTMLGPRLMDSAFVGGRTPSPQEVAVCEQRGLVPRILQFLFDACSSNADNEKTAWLTMSYLQIYQDRCYDLLQPARTSKPLKVREEVRNKATLGIVHVDGLKEVSLHNVDECLEKLIFGFKNIAFRATAFNEQSSRSHSILTLTLHQPTDAYAGAIRRSRVQLVDLAGNERWDTRDGEIDTCHTRELTSINRSLHVLGLCIQTLAQRSQQASKRLGEKKSVIQPPFRDSALTMVLRESLSGYSSIVLVSTISANSRFQFQSLSTLRFADRAKRVKLQVHKRSHRGSKSGLKSSK
jgi:hypothetical protein